MLKETLRIYPTAPGTSREVPEDIVIDGIHVPGGVTRVVSQSFLNVFLPLKQEVCVRTPKKRFYIVFLLSIHKGQWHLSLKNTHNETRHFFEY